MGALALLRAAMPNIPSRCSCAAATPSATPYPTKVTDAFVEEAARTGLDIFRIFDSLNDVDQMRPAVEAVLGTGTAVAEVALCYTGNLLDPREELYTLDYYLRLAEEIVGTGAHVLAIKDMAGLLRAPAATPRPGAARELRPAGPPPHPRHRRRADRHAPRGDRRRGGRRRRGLLLDGRHDEPAEPVGPRRRHRRHRAAHGLDIDKVFSLEPYWEAVRQLYKPFESGLASPRSRLLPRDPRRAAVQPAPAGHRPRARRPLRGHRGHVCRGQPDPRQPRQGDPLVKVVGDLALALVGAGADPADFEQNPTKYDIPDSVIGFLEGELGDPGRLARAVPHQGAPGPPGQARTTELTPSRRSRCAPTRGAP